VYVDNFLKNILIQKGKTFIIGVERNQLITAFNRSQKDKEGSQILALMMDIHGELNVEYSPC
jgi:hypothetical protein